MGNEGVVPDAAIVDAGPLIHLSQVDALELLSTFERVVVPGAVHLELADNVLRSQLDAIGLPSRGCGLVGLCPEQVGDRKSPFSPIHPMI